MAWLHPAYMPPIQTFFAHVLVSLLSLLSITTCHAKAASLGFTQLPQSDGGVTTVFYPSSDAEAPVKMGPFELSWAGNANVSRGNGRLIVISHGSGGSPWVHTDLARVLITRGFTVAVPQHRGDNYLDNSNPGPSSWALRPIEVSQAIDAVSANQKLSKFLSLDAVGIFGGSAGGHTALSLAGGEWSPSRFRDHCQQNIERDFSSCVGFTTLLHGNWIDSIKIWLAKRIISWRFTDDNLQKYIDPRIKASVAMVPFAADFLPQSLAEPQVPLGLVVAGKDINQVPSFHVDAIFKACQPHCEVVMNLPEAGHGAMLSPLPPFEANSIASQLLSDPSAFDRAASLPRLHELIADFFARNLL
ncbi:alpha/beta hydrolase family protein [Undibacterium curvum]|uniref:alpha/beta hydrolase family protein n=1 Tax=Undibacterium curvum TaxID=2762294 RepID=UPI003D14ED1A